MTQYDATLLCYRRIYVEVIASHDLWPYIRNIGFTSRIVVMASHTLASKVPQKIWVLTANLIYHKNIIRILLQNPHNINIYTSSLKGTTPIVSSAPSMSTSTLSLPSSSSIILLEIYKMRSCVTTSVIIKSLLSFGMHDTLPSRYLYT